MLYLPGDEIVCKLKDRLIVPATSDTFDEVVNLEIVVLFENGYFAFVPSRYNLKETMFVDQYNNRKYHVPPQFLESNIVFLTDENVVRLYNRVQGIICNDCKEFYYMAEPNQEDGTLKCYLCRENRYR